MRKALLIISILFPFFLSYSQNQLDSLMHAGIEYHDAGNYDKAIESFTKALEIDPESVFAHYELAMTYMYRVIMKRAFITVI